MLTVGDQFPAWQLLGVEGPSTDKLEIKEYSSEDFKNGWSVVFFWPKDFTFVCPTEIAAFGKLNDEFADRDAKVLGVSGDSEFVHHAWRKDHPDLADLPFPMLADSKHELMRALGVEGADGFAQRAVFIVDQNNEIQFTMVTAGSVGRNPKEVLRVLDALQTDELCPCNWSKGDETLDPVALLSGE
ncbi:peroxiredoxin [Streptomyces buecherae]|uniref:Alkyl hydroperoxide reductase C n=1 Tax=Streptomyces buecherae TaxID=2763006 RepID=A0A7G8KBG0_9ACTN|nr:peroxiredoxin [Streptomyces buecherae]MBC3984000.1 peroxiredoxin [Streptomyces buecherae]MBC3992214.1 peroxiredoxin [Streptomyces buecherae]QKW52093.1 peroxiredoxin [Streptomyces buecherae]QNJ40393.1 peroxiredoxin [Streptomyces buecherae]